MIEYLAYTIPLLFVILGYIFYSHKIHFLEAIGQLLIPSIFILTFKFFAIQSLTDATEYWTTYTKKVEYYEAWDEYIHQTCTRTVSCGENCTTTQTYDCSYVRYHDEKWVIVDNYNINHSISKKEYDRIVKKFKNEEYVDLNRDYHYNDGDKFVSTWPGTEETMEIVCTEHIYENRVQASSNVFNFPEISEEDFIQYGLVDYPQVVNYKQKHLLNWDDPIIERKLEIVNGKLGSFKEVKIFFIIYTEKDRLSARYQEWYWKGGNKNEFIVTIGVDSDENIQWSYPISWTENQKLKINVRNFIENKEKLDLEEIVNYVEKEVYNNFERKKFSDFNYLTIEMTNNQLIWLFIICFILSGILAIIFIKNDFDCDHYHHHQGWGKWTPFR